jgi:hypothetical protein
VRAAASLVAGVLLLPAAALGAPADITRRVAIRPGEGVSLAGDFERLAGWARREGMEIEIAPESSPVPPGWETARIAVDSFRRLAAKFPVRILAKEFVFDDRRYGRLGDAVALSDPAQPGDLFVVGVGREAAVRLLARRLFRGEDDAPEDFLVVSGGLVRSGRFAPGAPLAVLRGSGRDEIAERDGFFRALREETRSGARWQFRESERPAVARWEPVLERFLRGARTGRITVILFPDAAAKGRYAGSSRPADLSSSGDGVRLELDASAPAEPDLITPALASAAFASRDAGLRPRPILLAALGARACGRWWGRDVSGFSAFARRARVEPTPREVLASDPEVSPVLAVGAAASWIDAGIEKEGEKAVLRSLALADAPLDTALTRWAEAASARSSTAPARRSLPVGFLRGISYAMSNSAEASYASPRSRETLARVARMSVDSISIMPFAFLGDIHSDRIAFIHRNPGGETDEGTVHAVSDARSLGMSAMVKPQIWVGGVGFVGEIAMAGKEGWRRFFDAYRRFIVHHAVVAEAAGASLFCVGTELVGTEAREEEWRETIAAVRLATGAPLLYASNWATGAPRVPFWDALDAIGVDFYDSISKDPAATDAALERGVAAAAAPLEKLASSSGKPVIFAEAGYPAVRGAWMTPHDENSGRPPGSADAGRAIAAVFRALEGKNWWKGVYWWKVFSGGQAARPDDRGFNLLGTPSEKAITEGFSRMNRAGARGDGSRPHS